MVLFISIGASGQEICNNAIDDDGDGLIDLNDDECICQGFGGSSNVSSLIPNSSFEDRSCCPNGYSDLGCADTWIQASNPTSDYWHMCGAAGSSFDGGTVLPPPDGEGFVGFINMSGWQEYVGACLTATMTAGQQYDFTFWFGHTNNSPPIELTFYGTPNCGDLPFNSNDCPTGIGGFITLGSSTMGGGTGWVEESVSFTPPVDINAIVIGGACGSGGARTYYYLDDLTLVSTEEFEVLSIQQLGQYCDNNIVLDAETDTFGGTWQWYRDGIAIVGQTTDNYNVPAGTAGIDNYTVTYTIGNQCESIDAEVVEPDFPNAEFTADDVCLGTDVEFMDASSVLTGAVVDWKWDFGDGSISSDQNPTHTYSSPGTYTVELIATSDINCENSYQLDVTVSPVPVAEFSSSSACLGYPTDFTNESAVDAPATITSYEWIFGDGQTSAIEDPTNQYADAGTYDVQLKATTATGCADSVVNQITVNPTPIIDVSGSDECTLDDVVFANTSTISSGTIAVHNWEFGDGETSDQSAPIHNYQNAGTYSVYYSAASDNNCSNDTTFDVVAYPNPVAELQATDVCAYDSVPFSDLSSVIAPGIIDVIEFDAGDNSALLINVPNYYNYADAGTYNTELIVTTQHGCDDTVNVTVNVFDVPVADFSFSNICEDDSVQFEDLSSIPSGAIDSWLWDFGNGNSSTEQEPPFQSYPEDNFYPVELIVSSGAGCSDTLEQTIEVYPVPLAEFTFDSICFPEEIQFTDLSDPNGSYDISSWQWTFSDGQTSAEQNPSVAFAEAGQYSAELLISNNPGCKSTFEAGNAVLHPLPVAQFAEGLATCLEDTIFFLDESTVIPVTDDEIISWSWNLQDGNTIDTQNGYHIYENPDLFDVQLTVETNKGCTDDETNMVEIYPLPSVDFTAIPTSGCAPLRVNFQDLTTIPAPYSVSTWEWSFMNDSSIVTTQNPVTTYNPELLPLDVAMYDVWLRTTSANGCVSEILRPDYITVYPKPDALFAVDEDIKDIIDPKFIFTDLSSENVTGWDWTFGDGDYSDVQNPVHSYPDTGIYPIQLVVETEYGCLDTVSYRVKVNPLFTFYVPNSFTPDGNGINDEFFGLGQGYSSYSMYIYDRWGELIFESNDPEYTWDGTYKGQQVQQGTYVYRFYILDWQGHDHQYKGIVTLHR